MEWKSSANPNSFSENSCSYSSGGSKSVILGQPNILGFVPGVVIVVGFDEMLNKGIAVQFK